MTSDNAEHASLEPSTELEQELIRAYLAGAHHEAHGLVAHNLIEVRRILADASKYATSRVREIEERRKSFNTLANEM
jgi:hypothetical protein